MKQFRAHLQGNIKDKGCSHCANAYVMDLAVSDSSCELWHSNSLVILLAIGHIDMLSIGY